MTLRPLPQGLPEAAGLRADWRFRREAGGVIEFVGYHVGFYRVVRVYRSDLERSQSPGLELGRMLARADRALLRIPEAVDRGWLLLWASVHPDQTLNPFE